MYKIIGADGKEYGPVSAEQLRQWIAEGRVNAQTRVQAEGDAEWKPLGQVVEFVGLLPDMATGPAFAGVPPPTPMGAAAVLDIGDCIHRSWKLVKAHFALIVGATFLIGMMLFVAGMALRFGINFAFGVTFRDIARTRGLGALRLQWRGMVAYTLWCWIMTGPMVGGLYSLYLKLMRNQPAGIGDAFDGFGPLFGQLVLGSFVVSLLTTIGFLFCIIPGLYLSVSWKFTLPAIIDKRLGFSDAMELSRKSVSGRWWPVFALVLLSGLLAGAGMLACCIGVLVTAPIAIGAIMYAYEDLIGVQYPASR